MGSCKKIVTILSKSEDISFIKKARIQFHLFLCENCMRYKKHLYIINKNMKKFFEKRMEITEKEIEEIKKENYKKD